MDHSISEVFKGELFAGGSDVALLVPVTLYDVVYARY
jgi:hypothetical protein